MTTIIVLGLFWLLGAGLFAPALFDRHRDEQHRRPSRFEHLRPTSTYRPAQPGAEPQIAFRECRFLYRAGHQPRQPGRAMRI